MANWPDRWERAYQLLRAAHDFVVYAKDAELGADTLDEAVQLLRMVEDEWRKSA